MCLKSIFECIFVVNRFVECVLCCVQICCCCIKQVKSPHTKHKKIGILEKEKYLSKDMQEEMELQAKGPKDSFEPDWRSEV